MRFCGYKCLSSITDRPWQYDQNIVLEKKNIYTFIFNNTKIVLLPNKKLTLKQELGN